MTIEWCGHAPLDPDTREIVLNGVDVTATFSYDVGTTAGCSSYATSTGTIAVSGASTTLSGLIQDTDGFVGSSNVSYTLVQNHLISTAPHNGTNLDVSKCLPNCGGDVVLSVGTPAYRSLDTDRSLTLVYRDIQAHPTATITLDVQDTSTTRTVDKISIQVLDQNHATVVNVKGGPERFFRYPTYSIPAHPWLRLGARFVPNAPTGAYDYSAVVTSYYTDSTSVSTTVPVRVLVTNEGSSPYGGGWTIAGLARVYPQSNGSAVLTDGTGTVQYYAGVCAAAPCSYVTPLGEFAVLSKHTWGDGTLYDWRAPDGSTIAFGSDGRAAYAQDRFANRTSYAYDGTGRLTSVTDPVGKVIMIASVGTSPYGGPKLTITDPAARVTTLNLNVANDLVSVYDPAGGTPFQGVYWPGHYLRSWQDRRGGTWQADRDCAARVFAIASPLVLDTTVAMRQTHQDVQTTGCASANARGDRDAPTWASVPDSIRAIIINPQGNATRYAVDAFGAPTRIEDALGRVTIIQRDSMSRVTKVVTPSGHVIASTWSGPNVSTTIDSTTGRTIHYAYDSRYNLPMSVSGNTAAVQNFLNATGTLIDSTKIGGAAAAKFKYDSRGRDTLVSDPQGHMTRTHYAVGSSGNTDWIEGSIGHRTQFAYDAAGNPNLVTDALGHSTTMLLDALGRTQLTVGPRADTTRFTYDSLFLWKVTDAEGQVYRYDRNALGWLDSLSDPGLRVEHFTYDKNGNVTKHINRRTQTVSTSYDVLDRRLRLVAGPNDTTRFAYDPTDRWFAVANAASTDTVQLDVAGRRVAEISLRPHLSTTLRLAETSEYSDSTGVRRLLNWDTGIDHIVVWDYDSSLQLHDILTRGHYTIFDYNSDRQAATAAFPNGVTQSNSYSSVHGRTLTTFSPANSAVDLAFQVAAHEDSIGRTTERYRHALPNFADTNRVYSYDAAGQLTGYADRISAGKTCTQGPDHGETCSISNPQTILQESFSYDLVGNRTDSAGTISAGNRTLLFHGFSLAYDADGNLVSKSKSGVTDSLFWNSLGELVRVWRSGGDIATFAYDGMGRRVSKSAAGGTTMYQWDDQNVVAERDGSGAILTDYAFYPGVDHPHSITTGDSTYFVASEPPGNVIGLMSSHGNRVAAEYRYKPFGTMERNDTSVANSLRFQGRPYDAETGLYYLRSRYYDPELARFVSEDPIGLDGGANQYAFEHNAPIRQLDPTGLDPEIVCWSDNMYWGCAYWSDPSHGKSLGWGEYEWPSGENPNASGRGAQSVGATAGDNAEGVDRATGAVMYAGRLLTPWQPILENTATAELALVSSLSWGTRATTTVIGNYPTYLTVAGALGSHAFDVGERFGTALPGLTETLNKAYVIGRSTLGEDFRLALQNPFAGQVGRWSEMEIGVLERAGYVQKGLWWIRP